jgi:hypothetical protein
LGKKPDHKTRPEMGMTIVVSFLYEIFVLAEK